MYFVPLVLLLILAVIAVAWSPLFAVVLAGIAVVLFFGYIGLRPRADEQVEPPTGNAHKYEDETPKGPWGEPRE